MSAAPSAPARRRAQLEAWRGSMRRQVAAQVRAPAAGQLLFWARYRQLRRRRREART